MTTSSKYKTKRCSKCGAPCKQLDDNRVCYGCVLEEKIKKDGKINPGMEHPAIIKPKRQR